MRTWLRRTVRQVRRLASRSRRAGEFTSPSTDYVVADPEQLWGAELNGWQTSAVAERQDAAYRPLIERMYAGEPRQDFVAAANAVRRTGLSDPSILEVGCGSGYYGEVLSHLLQRPVRYAGLDYSQAMIHLARRRYADRLFVVGDAAALPFADGAFDIVLNGVSLMHILNYRGAIAESRRVARRWCIFHSVPVLQRRDTTVLRKRAYGEATVEVVFNQGELCRLLEQRGLALREVLESVPYNLERVLGEPTSTETWLCEVVRL